VRENHKFLGRAFKVFIFILILFILILLLYILGWALPSHLGRTLPGQVVAPGRPTDLAFILFLWAGVNQAIMGWVGRGPTYLHMVIGPTQ